MDALIEFIEGIGNSILAVINFFIGYYSDIIYLINLTGKLLAQLPAYFSWMPEGALGLLIVTFAIVVIYKILGREG